MNGEKMNARSFLTGRLHPSELFLTRSATVLREVG